MELFTQEGFLFLLRWIHFLAGITWIGMLYYFNFVQTPFFATPLGGEAKSAMMRGLAPNALWWFRWGAMFTFLSGWGIVLTHMVTGTAGMNYYALILTGGILGTLMWFNVWFVIWPRQRMAIESAKSVAAGGEADPEAAKQAPVGARASRTNTLFSIPMLFFMGSARHLSLVNAEQPSYGPYLLAVLIIAALLEAGIFVANPLHKQLASVQGTLTSGFVTTLILFLIATTLL
jgi:uncharacterized membrane protein